MPINSRRKGARVERLLRDKLNALGYETRRTAQRTGALGNADLEGIEGAWLEVKGGKRIHYEKALAQAVSDSEGTSSVPVVLSKKDGEEPVVSFRLKDLHSFLQAFQAALPARKTKSPAEASSTQT